MLPWIMPAMVTGYLSYVLFFAAGLVSAAGYCALLWYMTTEIIHRRSYVPLLFGTAVRLGLLTVAGGIIFLVEATAFEVLAAILGFVVGRIFIIRATALQNPKHEAR